MKLLGPEPQGKSGRTVQQIICAGVQAWWLEETAEAGWERKLVTRIICDLTQEGLVIRSKSNSFSMVTEGTDLVPRTGTSEVG